MHCVSPPNWWTDGKSQPCFRSSFKRCILDFGGLWKNHLHLVEFSYNNTYQASTGMAQYEALYHHPCKSPTCWIESGDRLVPGPDMIREASEDVDMIRKKLKKAQSRQKSYADRRCKNMKFSVRDSVFLKVSPMRGVVRFERARKLAPRYKGPFSFLKRIGPLPYRVQLPERLSGVHDVFHVSHLRKHVYDSKQIIETAAHDDGDRTKLSTYQKTHSNRGSR